MNEIKKLEGIGGWLILVVIALFLAIAITAQSLLKSIGFDHSLASSGFSNILIFERVCIGVALIFLIIITINFFESTMPFCF